MTAEPVEQTLNRPLALLAAGTLFMEILDGTIIATAAKAIAKDFRVSAVDLNIAMTCYLLTVAVGIPVSGWLVSRFGPRRILGIAIAGFTISSLLCALSPDLTTLCLARILQGASGAMMVPVGRLVVLRTTRAENLLQAMAFLTWPALVAPIFAPLVGGIIVTYASWHWIFLINVPLGIVAFIANLVLVPALDENRPPGLDWTGFVVSGLFLAAFTLLVEWFGTSPTPWTAVVISAVVSVLALAATVLRLTRARHPLLRLDALRIRTFLVGNAGGGVYRLLINTAPFLLPLMFQVGFGWSPVESGLLVMALFAGNLAIKPFTTPLIRRFGFRGVILGSSGLGAAVFALCGLFTPETPIAVILVVLFVSGALRSAGFSAYNTIQFVDVPAAGMTDANTLASAIQQVATGFGVAIGALILRVAAGVLGLGGSFDASGPYRWAFVVIGVLMLVPFLEGILMPRSAGHHATARS